MLQLKNVTKIYELDAGSVEALIGLNLSFRENEFVSVLGPSGCGKTTLLNLLGGLDRYTSGDLIISGKSTKDFSGRDWDAYRNRRIGFVFQNYNLIPHQTVLGNVELALTLAGVSKSERRRRAVEVLGKVGLSDQINKKPNQMSGGQMQRVSIARALINNPDILLADEPTGALDSQTSEQIMDLIRDIAKERLVIMVTHNGELAEKYSTRIIKLFDGKLVDDSNPATGLPGEAAQSAKKKGGRKTAMPFFTALSLSYNNLLTKKTRTFMTSFAGSIGIIGIALILALSSGSRAYIDKVQEDTLSAYPLSIEERTNDIGSMITSMHDLSHRETGSRDRGNRIYSGNIMSGMVEAMTSSREDNDLAAFKKHIENNSQELGELTNAITYGYNINLNIYDADTSDGVKQINPFEFMASLSAMGGGGLGFQSDAQIEQSGANVWTQMMDNKELLASQYDVLKGRWPQEKHEVVLVVDENNEITDYALYALGIKNSDDLEDLMSDLTSGKTPKKLDSEEMNFSYDELLALEYKLVLSPEFYKKTDGIWQDMRNDEKYMKNILKKSLNIDVTGIIRPIPEANSSAISGVIGYTSGLTEYIIKEVNASKIVKEQKADKDTDVFTGKPFADLDAEPEEVDIESLPMDDEAKLNLLAMPEEERAAVLAAFAPSSNATFEENIAKLGVADQKTPSMIHIYPKDFASKGEIESFITDYNQNTEDDSKTIHYTDYVGMMISSVSTVINMIGYILMAFVGISLVVSSMMIGIITYVSVLERTKEIGILKSIGASKSDISRVFNTETLIVGFVSGSLGVIISALLTIPANVIIKHVSGVSGIAVLPINGAVFLILLSMSLTLIAGLIPSKIAAKKDPVVALRTE